MKIAIVDDRPEEIHRLFNIVETALPFARITTFSSGNDFLASWKSGEYDLVLLDIFIGDTLGIDVARKIREDDQDVRLVFCTTSNEFACESYEVGANYYLHKPVSEGSVNRMLKMIRLDHYEHNRFLRLTDGQRIVLRNIIYSEYHNHTILIHCKNNETIQTRMSQTDWEALLSEHDYLYSTSKGIVANFYEVSKLEDGLFFMSDGSQVPISRRKSKDVAEQYASFRFQLMRNGGNSYA